VNEGKAAQAERLHDVMSENLRQTLWVLFAAVSFILLIACINVANLQLVRAAERQKELAVRQALGASRWRIVRQMLSESLLLSGLGGACGLLLGSWMLHGLVRLATPQLRQLDKVGLDTTVLMFALCIAIATSVLCGLLPALQSSKTDLQTALKTGERSNSGGGRETMRKALLIAEVSLSLVLLVGAGLLVRSMYNALNVDLGFDAENLLTMRVRLTEGRYDPIKRCLFYDDCVAQVAALQGVRSVALAHSFPIRGANWSGYFIAADKPVPTRNDLWESDLTPVSPGFFETMGITLLRGRDFSGTDSADSTPVVLVNEALTRRIWPGEDPIGKRLKIGYPEDDEPWREVIGVVNDIKLNGVESEISNQTYLPYQQEARPNVGLVVRTDGNPLAVATSVEQAIHSMDKDLAVYSTMTMDQMLGNSLAQRRLTLVLLSGFAGMALLLAAVGIYGVISFAIRQRTREIGIRMALGARRIDVLRLVIGQGVTSTLIGIGLGLSGAWALTRLMESLLFGVESTDQWTFAGTALLLFVVSLLACWIPARWATKVDPLTALRHE
jgi:putative ABC transport system permease protein